MRITLSLVVLCFVYGAQSVCLTDHWWNQYHWSFGSGGRDLTIANCHGPSSGRIKGKTVTSPLTTSDWSEIYQHVVGNWVMDDALGYRLQPVSCNQNADIVMLNDFYGNTGWLGIAEISVSDGMHIDASWSKFNDYYGYKYGDPKAVAKSVQCQEVGHTLGMDHQSETGENCGSCMDYWSGGFNLNVDAEDTALIRQVYNLSKPDGAAGHATWGSGGGGGGGGRGPNIHGVPKPSQSSGARAGG
uniref:Peptidase M10 metallopeptidase domain-containing protein n=1 Tax=Eutreptiella gymnastica TaxID=73025 RepID=A0A7S1IYG1_9EUGL|mmetsp:Transcript_53331/g.95197  ORF Transcript_53331/g.95197 Transcript_53331/m.95197 type:complete len:244 (+) Transcript_53331:59-790(+)